jgi:rRNA maturation RNase YbeY
MLSLDLTASAPTGRPFLPHLKRHLPKAHALLRPALAELSVALVGNARMAALHQQFMAISGPTDVLTFELDYDPRGRVTAGEVVVCVPHALREARRRRRPPRDEVLLYALHGMLHLCGYDDRTARDFARMHRREDQILDELGVGAVFATETARTNGSPRPAARLKGRGPGRRPASERATNRRRR